MKNLYAVTLVFIFTGLFGSLRAQEAGKVRFSLAGERIQYTDRNIQSLGLDFEIFVSDHLSMSYRFALGGNSDGELFAHIPVGAWLASYPLTAYGGSLDEITVAASVILLLIPESFNTHFFISDNVRVSPFVAPLGMFYENTAERRSPPLRPGFSTGLRTYFFKNNLSFVPYLGARSLYSRGSTWGIFAGFTFGIAL